MATLRQNVIIRPSELRTSVLQTALDMGIQNETVAKWIFDPVAEEEEEEETSMGSPSLLTASTAPSIIDTSSTSQAASLKSYKSSLVNSTISNPYHNKTREEQSPNGLISGSLSSSVASNLSPQSTFSPSPSPSKKQKWHGLKIRRQPEIGIQGIKTPEEKKVKPVEFKVSRKKGIKAEDDFNKRDASPLKKRTKSSKSKSSTSPDAEGYESEGQFLSPKKHKENEKKIRSLGRTISGGTPPRDDQDQGYLSEGAALTPSKKKKSFFKFERKTPSIPDLRSPSSNATASRNFRKPSTPPMPTVSPQMSLPIAERFARIHVGGDADFVRSPSVYTSASSQSNIKVPSDAALTTDIWNDAVLLGSTANEKKNKSEVNDNASAITSSVSTDNQSMISSSSVVETLGSHHRSEESNSSTNPTLTVHTPWLSRKPSRRKITPADISLPTTHFVDLHKTSPSTQASASPASSQSFSTSSSGQSFVVVDPDISQSKPRRRFSPPPQPSIQTSHDSDLRGRTERPTLTVIPPRDTTPPRHQERSPQFDQGSHANRNASASLLAYYGLPPPSPAPQGPLPGIPPVSSPSQRDADHRRLSPLRSRFSRQSRSRSPMAYKQEVEQERVGLYAQPIPAIRRGRESPFPIEPILPPEDSYNLIQKSILPAPAPRHTRVRGSRSPSYERTKAFLDSSFETSNDRMSDEDWPDINAPRRSDDVYDEDDDASCYTSDDRTASRSTIVFFEEDARSSIYSKASVLNAERSAEIRRRFIKRTAALFGPDGRELENEIPPVPPLPAGLALGYDVSHDPFSRY